MMRPRSMLGNDEMEADDPLWRLREQLEEELELKLKSQKQMAVKR